MPGVFYVVQLQPSPGRGAAAVEQLLGIKQVVVEAGAIQCRILQSVAGPGAQTLSIASEWESMGAFEASRATVLASAAFQAAQGDTNPPAVIVAQSLATEVG